ncbi:MAG: hypothetical protein HUU16_03960 [Candidatus Omnitrophica bacterium]|nr:hypothetical protein [bacterium]NUN95306.1 hypothetical protein [Candidatus Omnitrophota bacterium]
MIRKAVLLTTLSLLLAGCMAPFRAAGGLAKSVADTTVTGAKAGGKLLMRAVEVPTEAARDAWREASTGRAPEVEPPPMEP